MGSTAPGVLAFGLGFVLAVAGFVPWVAVQYRRHGTLRAGSTMLAFGVLVYALAVMAYTFLPLPTDTATMCLNGGTPPQTRLFKSWDNIQQSGGYRGPASLMSNWAIAQVLFNVLLFVPLGMFVRHAVRRTRTVAGIAVATTAGFLVSLFVECTQLSGDWFLYPCAAGRRPAHRHRPLLPVTKTVGKVPASSRGPRRADGHRLLTRLRHRPHHLRLSHRRGRPAAQPISPVTIREEVLLLAGPGWCRDVR